MLTHTHAQTHTHARTHARTHAHTHTHTNTHQRSHETEAPVVLHKAVKRVSKFRHLYNAIKARHLDCDAAAGPKSRWSLARLTID